MNLDCSQAEHSGWSAGSEASDDKLVGMERPDNCESAWNPTDCYSFTGEQRGIDYGYNEAADVDTWELALYQK